ncbi:formate dehydrogenase accessory sulfurtransferase FdhD [Marinomonas atlantica]|uniref:formate dehydrogenase accessory sulfurtransferase FdhD n=1 Tax=Marinomonas atlantica TaxID=1806668 RepID=UPI0008369099|nr:formate dehydrogenase accessory sulfurtransferase FdhD [Marinomonas atlantica]MCO4786495.1 formate dehydrogenase accessory sulfurtransferase FdhD [Marinomonas atlantica]
MNNNGTQKLHYANESGQHQIDLVEEVPIAISVNDLNYAVILITPVDIEAFVIGFAHSEGLIEQTSEVLDIDIKTDSGEQKGVPTHITANLKLTGRAQHRSSSIMRQRKGSSGCGLCGIEAIEQSFPCLIPLSSTPTLTDEQWSIAKEAFSNHQLVGGISGAIHGAMLMNSQGEFLCFAEDIGRHNALDKLVGKALTASIKLEGCHILMSSRCSTELILKAVRAQVASLGHLASPSTLAVAQAKQYGLHLVHIPRRATPRHYN